MIGLAALALAANAQPPRSPTAVVVQAEATIRIISGVAVDFSGKPAGDVPVARETTVRVEGAPERVRLIEFE